MLQTFLAELKRRKVLRVVGAYAVAAWGALQVADKLFPALTLPPWTVTLVAVLLLFGLPITAVIAWAFEITADGVKRTTAEPGPEAVGAKVGWVEPALLLAILGAVAISFVQLTRHETLPATTAAEPSPRTTPDSIAVLPFTSFSSHADSNYFADGLTEELINNLAHIPGLKVSGRTSSFYFKNRNEDLREIGRTLGVAQVLEGSVRRSGDKLRITVQLISTADGFHLWSQTYDRGMSEIFAIQDDVANNVASVLEVKLAPPKQRAGNSLDTEDYRLYLVALALLRERTLDSLTQAREIFARLRDHSPDNVDALAGLTRATMMLASSYLTLDFAPAAKEALGAIDHALAVNPDSVPANVAAGSAYAILLQRTGEARYGELAEHALAHAVELAPDDPDVLASYGLLLNTLERYDDAYAALQRAVRRDPLSRLAHAQLVTALEGLGRLAEAREKLLVLMQMYPDYVFAPAELGELLMNQGQLDAAVPYLRAAHAAKTSPRATFALANAYLNLGLDDDVRKTLAELDYAPLSQPLAQAIQLRMHADDAGLFQLAQAQLAQTNDPIWRLLVINSALTLGDLPTARRELTQLDPALLTSFDATRAQPEAMLFAGELLTREGNADAAKRILETLLTKQAPPAEGFDPIARKMIRAKALALLGRNDAAIDELRAARLQGNRMLWEFDYFQRMDRLSAFATLRDDARFRTIIAEIETDNRAMRDRLAATAANRL